jgi:predicted nucleotide-binding protein (sugar kinase/HSP70/actin superfamily)
VNLKATVPGFGLLYISLNYLFNKIGIEYIAPPKISKKSFETSLTMSPEQICLPFKYNVANYIDAINKGADTIFIAGGHGPCRFGLYGYLQSKIIKKYNSKIKFIVINQDNIIEFINELITVSPLKLTKFKILKTLYEGFKILKLAEKNYELALKQSVYEKNSGETFKVMDYYNKILSNIKDISRLKEVKRQMLKAYKHIELEKKETIKIGVSGEIYMVIEDSANFNLRKKLSVMEVESSQVIHISEWIMILLKLDFLNRKSNHKMRKTAAPYMFRDVGGKGLYSVASTINYKNEGFDGVIHLTPFGCMPEIVAQSIMRKVITDYDIPVLFLNFDEHSGEIGFETRVEAFVDMLKMKKKV